MAGMLFLLREPFSPGAQPSLSLSPGRGRRLGFLGLCTCTVPERGLAKLIQLELRREGGEGALGVCVCLSVWHTRGSSSSLVLGSGGDQLPEEAGVPGAGTHLEYIPLADPEPRQCGPGELVLALPPWARQVCVSWGLSGWHSYPLVMSSLE